jgi:hypothetical protein
MDIFPTMGELSLAAERSKDGESQSSLDYRYGPAREAVQLGILIYLWPKDSCM